MLPIANEPNMVSGNVVNNCKDLKGSFNHETDSQKLPERTILYGQKDIERIASQDMHSHMYPMLIFNSYMYVNSFTVSDSIRACR